MYDKATIFTYVAKYIYLRTYNDEIDIIEGMVHFTILNSLTLSKYIICLCLLVHEWAIVCL